MSVKVDAKKDAPRILSTDDAIKMKVEAELSNRQLFAVLRCIRAFGCIWEVFHPEWNNVRSASP